MIETSEVEGNLVIVTEDGLILRIKASEFGKTPMIGIDTWEGDRISDMISLYDTLEPQVIIFSENGMAIRFDISQVPFMDLGSHGVRGIRLEKEKRVIGAVPYYSEYSKQDEIFFVLTKLGYVKVVHPGDVRQTTRGGKGVRIIDTEKYGDIIAVSN